MQGSGSATLMLWDLSGVVGEQHASGAGTCSEGESHLALHWVPHLTDDSCRFRGTIQWKSQSKQYLEVCLIKKCPASGRCLHEVEGHRSSAFVNWRSFMVTGELCQ